MVTLLNKIYQAPFVRKAIEDKADLSAFREKPSFRILAGVFAIAFSYVPRMAHGRSDGHYLA